MTTSGTINSTMIASEVVVAALQEIGVYAANETPTAEDLEVGIRALNWMLKSLQARGYNLWRETTGNISIPANSAYGELQPDIQEISSARTFNNGQERPLMRWERGQYMSLPNKGQAGNPSIFYVERTVSNLRIHVWPVPRVTTAVLLDYVRTIEDVTDGAQTLDIPQEWLEAVYLHLAVRLASTFGVTRTDPATVQLLAQRAEVLTTLLLDQDRPASVRMGSRYTWRY